MIKLNFKEVEFKKFPNNETLMVHESINIVDKNLIQFKYETDADLIKLLFLKKYIDNYNGTASLIIYYMPYSRMDRSEGDSAFTLKYVTEFINALEFKEVTILEGHSNVSTALLNKAKNWLINEDLIDTVLDNINFDVNKDYIMYPDAGASSRYKNFKYPNVIIGNKNRDFSTGEIKGLELIGHIENEANKVLIVDDLSSYGGTFVHSAKKLKEEGFKEVYLLVAHAENSIFKGELFKHIDKVFTTDSLLTEQNFWENKKFENQLHVFEVEKLIKTKGGI